MKPIVKSLIGLVLGYFCGCMVNAALIELSGKIIAPPTRANITSLEGLKASMHLFEPKHFLMPFLAHALGTFVAAYIAARFAHKKLLFAMIIGLVFFIGGVWMITLVPSPVWFTVVDLCFAYFPMAYLASKLAK